MHFLRPVLLAAACLTISVFAAPISTSYTSPDLSARGADGPSLVRRVLTPHRLSGAILATQKQQVWNKTVKKDLKKQMNRKATSAGKTVNQARKEAKAQRGKDWKDGKRVTTSPLSKAAKKAKAGNRAAAAGMTAGDRKQVKTTFRDAAKGMRETKNIPHSKDQFTVGANTVSGKHVRTAVMNTYLHGPVRLGRQQHPKDFNNNPQPNPNGAPGVSRLIHNPNPNKAPMGLKEYPVKAQPHGWLGGGPVGGVRVLTSTQGGKRQLHAVVGHQSGTQSDDHHRSVKTPHDNAGYEAFVGDAHKWFPSKTPRNNAGYESFVGDAHKWFP